MPSFDTNTASFGADLSLKEVFGQGIPFEGPIDINYFVDLPTADVALQALAFLDNESNEIELRKRHSPSDLARMWRGVFRALIQHGLEVPFHLRGYARRLGVVIAG